MYIGASLLPCGDGNRFVYIKYIRSSEFFELELVSEKRALLQYIAENSCNWYTGIIAIDCTRLARIDVYMSFILG